MKADQFNELCHREYANGEGVVTRLHLTRESCAELLADITADAGARLDAMTNPATRTVVGISLAPPFTVDTAEIARPIAPGPSLPLAPVREIPIRRRDPAEARSLMIAGGIPEDMADEILAES